MKIMKRLLANSKGMSLPLVLIIVSASIGSIGYVAMNLIPKLQEGQKKAEQAIHYRIFFSSLNDYMVHAIRERWCINVNNFSDGIAESDLLVSNECSSTKPMEDIVTFNGNLERALWDATTIGEDGTEQPITILGLNYHRRQPVIDPPGPAKTTRVLTKAEVELPENKMTFRVTEDIMNDMTNVHPLFTLTQNVKGCLNYIDIEVTQIISGAGAPQGDEKKLKIHIKGDLKKTRLSCLAHKVVESTSYYTFYPRRLHSFALIKYGNLDASMYNEFHGPVYLAGHLKLPATATNIEKSTIFYDTLTLGTYNGGTADSGVYEAGMIINSDNTPYTFEAWGNPYQSKQNNYETFRGILGGLRLDAVEDKGLYNIFDYTSTSNADVATLEACVDENKVKTTPSMNDNSVLAYSSVTEPTGTIRFKMGFTLKNRFKPTIYAPAELSQPADGESKKFIMTVPEPPNGVKSIGALEFTADSSNVYSATMGNGSSVSFKLDLEKYNITTAMLDAALLPLQVAISTKATYPDVIPANHVLRQMSEYTTYIDKAGDLINKCDNKPSIAHCLTPFPTDYALTTCDHTVDPQCNQSTQYNAYVAARSALKTKLETLKTALAEAEDPTMIFTLESIVSSDKEVINQKMFQASFTNKWRVFYHLLGFSNQTIKFTSYHFGNQELMIKMELKNNSDLMDLRNQQNNNNVDFQSFTGWKNTFNNQNIASADDPEELFELECPTGMGFADWDLDMSGSSNFAWNYANTPPGVPVDVNNHYNLSDMPFDDDANFSGHYSGVDKELTKSVVLDCTVKKERKFVYGFYACKKLTIEGGRANPLYLIGTFIVKDLINNETVYPVYWHSVWTPTARDLVMTELNASTAICQSSLELADKTFVDVLLDMGMEENIKKCSSQELVTNGPNNFTWTTIDPEIGIDPANPAMTSQKVRRFQRWVTREDSRKDMIK